ncbi:phosphonate C-P lyase system protein PhnG [Oceanobacillus sp. 143]|uniref:Phosphonate C-P lyase system protein PhnG n=1 Tax=Oceanobacillus zhaokaii TaxID=2052660 RepID=A0A345PMJ6_9BACI|nr:phosphonate C-P lyase system protein PhnG [Oceanobacillus zhaokaii]AXI11226.1 phosphonate C-P lyase system protein PhnG [Oceanobacillus zhaokaii]QGS69985.1 phosphonate C-P lyase system protein PhnG [Oceanobacillus sp. 143]
MKRRRRTEILIQSDSSLARSFAEMITQNHECQEIVAPQYGLTMIKMRESAKNSLFYIGEVLVTEAKVEINNQIGIGIVVGMQDELAKHLAIIDAAYKANLPEVEEWNPQLQRAEQQIMSRRAKEQADLFETKVNFETMDV